MKRFFNSPQPLAFFGFLLTFMLTVAWRVPLQGSFFGVAQAATQSPPSVPVPEPAPVPMPIPQVLPMTLPTAPIVLGASPVFAQTSDVSSLPNAVPSAVAKKKGHNAHKTRIATATTTTSDENLASLLSAAAEGKTTKKRAHRE